MIGGRGEEEEDDTWTRLNFLTTGEPSSYTPSRIFIAVEAVLGDIDEIKTTMAPVALGGRIEGKAFGSIKRNSSKNIAITSVPIPRKL